MATMLPCGAQAKTSEDYLSEMQDGLPEGFVEDLSKDLPMAKDLLRRCASREPWRRRSACMYLARGVAKPELADEIKLFLGDRDHGVRRDAIAALADSLGEAAIPELKRVAVDDKESFNRAFAISSISGWMQFKRPDSKHAHHQFLRDRLDDKSPLVRLRAAMWLARDGISVPRQLAIENLDAPAERYSEPSGLAYELLGFVGNEEDLKRLQKLIDEDKRLTPRQRLEYVKAGREKELDDAYKAGKAVTQLRMTLAKSEVERKAILRQEFRTNPAWAGFESERRYVLGETTMLDFLAPIAVDSSHPGAESAARVLQSIRERLSREK